VAKEFVYRKKSDKGKNLIKQKADTNQRKSRGSMTSLACEVQADDVMYDER